MSWLQEPEKQSLQDSFAWYIRQPERWGYGSSKNNQTMGMVLRRRRETTFLWSDKKTEELELSNVFFMFAMCARDSGLVCRSGLRCRIFYTLIFLKRESVEFALETAVLLIQHANS